MRTKNSIRLAISKALFNDASNQDVTSFLKRHKPKYKESLTYTNLLLAKGSK